jgi:hypothetical protein
MAATRGPSNEELSEMVKPLVRTKLRKLKLKSKNLQPTTENFIKGFVPAVFKIQAYIKEAARCRPNDFQVKLRRSAGGFGGGWIPAFVISSSQPETAETAEWLAGLPWSTFVKAARPWPKYWMIIFEYEEQGRDRRGMRVSDHHQKNMPRFEGGESYLAMAQDFPEHGTTIELGWFRSK